MKLETDGLAASTINVRLAAIRKLAREAADNGLLAPDPAAGIARVRGAKALGVRAGNWLGKEQTEQMIAAPDPETLKGKRDRVILVLLLGCGLRRNEVAGLTFEEVQLETNCVAALAAECDSIVHLAAAVGVRRILADPLGAMRINVAGTESVLAAALRPTASDARRSWQVPQRYMASAICRSFAKPQTLFLDQLLSDGGHTPRRKSSTNTGR